MRPARLLICFVLSGFLPLPAPGATPADPSTRPATGPTPNPVTKAEVDQLFQPLVDGEWVPGVVVGVVTEDGRRVYGYGRVSGKDGRTPDGRTVYEIGSVSKVFTSLILADMARRGEVALDDPVQKFLPESVHVPQRGDKPITLQHLATHMSGLPRMPGNFGPKDPSNPYADYTVEQMYAFLNECKPARDPGGGYEYSNLAVGLLGHVLARRAGKPYEQLLAERVTGPLAMADTRIALTDDQRTRLSAGHDADGEPQPNWDIPTFAGAGAIRSTADDLLTFLAAQAGITPADKVGAGLAAAMTSTHERRAAAGPGLDMALGWHIDTKNDLPWHTGQTGGYHSFVAFSPDRKFGVVVLANAAAGTVDAPASALLRRLLGRPLAVPDLPKPVAVAPDVLERYVGKYLMPPATVVTITRKDDRLYAQLPGQPRLRIFPRSETAFFYKAVNAQIDFTAGPLARLMLHQNGRDIPALRMKADTGKAGADKAGGDAAGVKAEPNSAESSTRPAHSGMDGSPKEPAAQGK